MRKMMITIMLLMILPLTQACVPHTTGETEVGVQVKKLALWGEKGVSDRIFSPGSTFFFLPFINDWYTFDTKLQNMEMTFQRTRGDRPTQDDLLFKTIDGNDIGLDVIIAYRIMPEKAPYILQYVAENDDTLRDKIVRTIARSKPRDIFGELKTEDFYIAKNREAQAQEVKKQLQAMFDPMGVIIERVLTKDYRFNPAYQKAIEDKKVADQMVEKNRSAQHATQEEYLRKLEQAKGEVNKMVADIDGEYLKAKIEVDAYYEKQKLIAQAIKAEGIAEAQGIQEMNTAMASAGGEAFVKLRIAESLQGKEIFLLPVSEGGMNLKTTDINDLINTMGIKKLSDKSRK